MKKPSTADIIRAAQSRAGLYRKTEKLCRLCCVPETTFRNWLRSGDIPLSGLQRLNTVLHFTDEELGGLIRR